MSSESTSRPSPTLTNGMVYNSTVLRYWNYTLYNNGTLSNGSDCWLVFGKFQPVLCQNGTFTNATSCDSPVNKIQARGITGLVFGSAFALTIVFTTINLRKHGRSYLPPGRRWRAVGRRWQWYWMLFVATCCMISAFTGVDVDRDYILNTPFILQSVFMTLMVPGLLASVWEAVRHWGSWQYRQRHDVDPFAFRHTDRRSQVEFYLPLIFYAFDSVVFVMTTPRSWSALPKQRSPEQTSSVARPMALDGRFKAGALLSVCCLCLICLSLFHSRHHYQAPLPPVLVQVIVLLGASIGYLVAASWVWAISPYRAATHVGWLYGLGYGPPLLILLLLNLRGFLDENEDIALIAQQTARDEADRNLLGHGQVQKPPSWWNRSARSSNNAARLSAHDVTTPSSPFSANLEMKFLPPKSKPSTQKDQQGQGGQQEDTNSNGNDEEDADESGSRWWWQRRRKEVEAEANVRAGGDAESTSGKWSKKAWGNKTQNPDAESDDDGLSRQRVLAVNEEASTHTYSAAQSVASLSSSPSLNSRPQVVRSMLDAV